jgi:hypothetical protein
MRRTWMRRGQWPLHALISAVAADERRLKSAEPERLTGRQTAARRGLRLPQRWGARAMAMVANRSLRAIAFAKARRPGHG